MHEFNYFIYDMDGCLIDSMPIWLNSVKVVSAEFGLSLTDEQIKDHFHHLLRIKNYGLSDEQALDYRNKVRAMSKEKALISPAFDGVENSLKYLVSKGKKLGIVTSNNIGADVCLRNSNIWHYFDAVVTGDMVKKRKPDPEGIELALKLMRGTRKEAVMIGDAPSDIEAAKNAKIKSILFMPNNGNSFYKLEDFKCRPDYIILHHSDMRRLAEQKIKSKL